jgi:hypothetical protein
MQAGIPGILYIRPSLRGQNSSFSNLSAKNSALAAKFEFLLLTAAEVLSGKCRVQEVQEVLEVPGSPRKSWKSWEVQPGKSEV